ncbi:MAG: AraC family transcriptional regulator [Prevotella sp.]|jgi:AraC-like DNA-binding protein
MQISKYLVASPHDQLWGLTVSTVGQDELAPGDEYPTRGHADGYYFDVERGRTLNEYQLLYLVEGEGIFRSASVPEAKLHAGDLFLLFPGEWHTYHPLESSRWKSYWIGFKGKNMDDRVKAGFLFPLKPVYHVGFSAEIVRLYESALKTAQEEAPFAQQTLAGIVNHLVGLMYSLKRNNDLNSHYGHLDMVNHARLRIRQSLEEDLSIQQIAKELGTSYSNLRKLFKEYTGVSPALYQQDLRLQRAKELLTTTNLSIKQVAYRLCFESPDYFSTKFKNKTGLKPSEFREQMH